MGGSEWRTWREAMHDALYGPGGFYRSAGAPARHFRTSAHTGPAWAQAIAALVERVDDALGRPDGFTVVEIGAGQGELLTGLGERAPERWELVGVDLAPRPAALPAGVGWREAPPAEWVGVLIAVEWLDVVPVDVVELTEAGPRVVEVDAAGEERVGAAPTVTDAEWLTRWWPLAEVGDRAEIGRPRDEVWRDAVARVRAGAAVAVDSATAPARDVAGTMTGYRVGRQVAPVPDGSMDVTAHVLFESVAAAAAATDGETIVLSQRDALHRLGVRGERPSYGGDPSAYLAALSHAGDEAELLDPAGLGGFTWLVQAIGTRNPLAPT